jgi:hypothetical protein
VEVAEITRNAADLDFRELWVPGRPPGNDMIGRILSFPDRRAYVAGLPLDLSAPTDDRPFFFLNVRSILNPPMADPAHGLDYARTPVRSLRILYFLLVSAALAWTILPLILARGGGSTLFRILIRRPQAWLYFAGIGTGFMLVEVCLLQRYVLFLGHPTYASSVVLFSLLLSAGLGSITTSCCCSLLRPGSFRGSCGRRWAGASARGSF